MQLPKLQQLPEEAKQQDLSYLAIGMLEESKEADAISIVRSLMQSGSDNRVVIINCGKVLEKLGLHEELFTLLWRYLDRFSGDLESASWFSRLFYDRKLPEEMLQRR